MVSKKSLYSVLALACIGLMLPALLSASPLERSQTQEDMPPLEGPVLVHLDEGPDGAVTGVVVARSLEECTAEAEETCEDGVDSIEHDSKLWGLVESCEFTCK